MQLKDLKPNKKNPRKISDKKLDALKKSVDKFGDLSGFVYNIRTKQLVSGHQRSKTIPPSATIKVEVRHERPTAAMTVAEGYVLHNEERFKYREVDASPEWEVEALLAANKHGGEWDKDLLRLNLADFPNLDLEVSGFTVPELKMMDIDFNPGLIAPLVNNIYLSDEEESDEDYLKNNPGPDYREDKERLPDLINRVPNDNEHESPSPLTDVSVGSHVDGDGNPFDSVDENTVPQGRRVVLIIDCDGNDELKKELKEKLRPIVDGTGAKFF